MRPRTTRRVADIIHAKYLFPIALLATMGIAFAGSGKDEMGKSFDEIDANGDGMVTREEAAATPRLEESFEQLDANADGVLSPDEIGVGGPGTEEAPESE